MEDGDSRTGVVVARHARRPDLDDERHRGRPTAVRDRRRSAERPDHPRPQGIRRRDSRSTRTRSIPTRRRRRSSSRAASTLRSDRPGTAAIDTTSRQGALGAARLRVQPLPRRRLVTDPLREPADHALRRQRSSVPRRARQANRQDRVATPAVGRFPGSGARTASRKPKGDFRKGFATPHVLTVGGRPVLISLGSKATYGYDPRTGAELWKVVERRSHSPSTRPVAGVTASSSCRPASKVRNCSPSVPTAKGT